MTIVKSHEKNVEIIFSKLPLPLRYGEMSPNVNFKEMDTECSTGKMIDFEYCEE